MRMLSFSSVIVCMQAGRSTSVMVGMVPQLQSCISMYLQASLVQVGREWARRTKALAKPMVIPQNKVLDVLADGDALLMQPPNSRCGAFIILADSFAQDNGF